jgi:hypothetical protein
MTNKRKDGSAGLADVTSNSRGNPQMIETAFVQAPRVRRAARYARF